mgnify:CR=1 FL=1
MSYYLLSHLQGDLQEARNAIKRSEKELDILLQKAGIQKMTIWDRLRYFNEDENWVNPDKMQGYALLLLDAIRHEVDSPFIILCGQEERKKGGEHPKGHAIDGYCPELEPIEMYLRIEQSFRFLRISELVGFGIYPLLKPTCGWHIDFRGIRARWGAIDTIRNKNGRLIRHEYGSIEQAVEMIR